jgi:hypothetical protein
MQNRIATVIAAGSLIAFTGCYMFQHTPTMREQATQAQANMDKIHPAKVVPAQNFPEAQKLGWEGATARAGAMSPPATILKVYPIYGYDWGFERNDLGVVQDRIARIMVVYKGGASGFCRQEDTNVTQQSVNGSWTRPVVVLGQMGFRIDCNDVDKFPGANQ